MRDLATRLQDVLNGRYAIKREIGRGGMATVFLAWDVRHERDVALKVLHPFIASGVGSRRFEQEIRLAARLQHPHIVTVHDSGVVPDGAGEADLLWFTMPFVEGESLRDRLRREQQLPLGDAIRITRQISDALDYAHRNGVIHRDIKPENILLTGNHALVADFGVAMGTTPDGKLADSLTEVGMTVGTVTYMSPEQCSAERNLDARSDQYAVGTVLYEMLVGEPPFTGPTSQIIMNRRFSEDPRPLRSVRPGVSESVERVVATALARLPADRYATMADFSSALDGAWSSSSTTAMAPVSARKRLTGIAAVAAALVLAVVLWRFLPNTATAADAPLQMAVLPFHLRSDTADAYFAEGMAEEINTKLYNLPGFELRSRYSTMQYRRMDKPLDQIAAELNVRYLLIGTLEWRRKPGEQQVVVVRAELVEVPKGGTPISKWLESFNFPFTDVFDVQSEIATRIAGALRVAVTPEVKAVLAESPTKDSAAYIEFMRGEKVYFGSSGGPSQLEALARYENAVALDPAFARAWARLSMINSSIFARTTDSTRAAAAQRAADRAIELAPKLPEAYLAIGNRFTLVENNYARAIEAYQAGLKLQPDHPELLSAVGLALQGLGRYDEAIANMRRGLVLNPLRLVSWRQLTRALTYDGKYADAEEASRQALAIAPRDQSALQYAVLLRLAQGDLAGAKTITRALPKEGLPELLTYWSTNFPINVWFLDEDQKDVILRFPANSFGEGDVSRFSVHAILEFRRGNVARARLYADSLGRLHNYRLVGPDPNLRIIYAFWASLTGRTADAFREGEAALASRANDHLNGPPIRHNLIQVYLFAGEHERALDHLEVLVTQKYYVTPAWLRIDPSFDLLREHPRFKAILAAQR